MRARAPASSANLGPGFDVLAVALDLHVEVQVRAAPRLLVRSEGEGADLPSDETHLAARIAIPAVGHDRLEIVVKSTIPVGRGLGSSAALAVAAAAAAGADDPFAVAVGSDGHAENAAASALGGLVAATIVDGRPVARRLPLDPGLSFVLLVPDHSLVTEAARAVLPQMVPFADAVANLGRMGLLVAGLADRAALLAAAGEDRLHQDARSALFPEAPELLRKLREAGARVACWSGAGPSLLGICDSRAAASKVRDAGERALSAAGVAGRAVELLPELAGLRVWPD
jgi:homoserine kinase